MRDDDKVLLAKKSTGDLAAEEAAHALADAAREAGALALSMQQAGVRIWNKDQDSPVTEADIAVDAMLRERLGKIAPDYIWQSEESIDIPDRPSHRRRWIVDPIDGTRAFIKKQPDWSIATALLEDGRPIAAALFVPVTDEMFIAFASGGAARNGVAISATRAISLTGARIAGPRFTLERLESSGVRFETVPRIHSLALRFARAAAGEIDAALSSENSRDWDLAAADLLVHEAGGALTNVDGARILYNRADARHPPLAASGTALHGPLIAAVGKILANPDAPEHTVATKVVK
jgi:myo-inositol-1(or 4)-monophosphatase